MGFIHLACFLMTVLSTCYASPAYISRHNYGYSLQPLGQVMLTTGRVRLIFYFFPEIELRRQESDFNCATQYPSGQPQRRCEHFKGIVLNLYALKNDIIDHLADRMAEIDEILYQLPREGPRTSCGIFSWIGSGIANIFVLVLINICNVFRPY